MVKHRTDSLLTFGSFIRPFVLSATAKVGRVNCLMALNTTWCTS